MEKKIRLLFILSMMTVNGIWAKKDLTVGETIYSFLQNMLSVWRCKIDTQLSHIISPFHNEVVNKQELNIVGILRDSKGNSIQDENIALYLDDIKCVVVKSNEDGVWRYRISEHHKLSVGTHSIKAVVVKSDVCVGKTQFSVSLSQKRSQIYRVGNIDPLQSQIFYPHEGAIIGHTTPLIIGNVNDAQGNPIENETINISIDNTPVGADSSDQNGIWLYRLTPLQALSDGQHTVTAFAVESNVQIGSNTFTVDTQPPAAPVIVQPAEGETVNSNIVPASGTSEAHATIYIYIDGSEYYQELTETNESGNWAINLYLDNGSHFINAQAQDHGRNLSPISASRNFTVSA